MYHVRAFAQGGIILLSLMCLPACGSNDFNNAYSHVAVGHVGPIPLDD